ncbi:Exocyst complex component SEC3 [Psilocybe cubensis]|uniref:Exocyst complex component SEC3 n=1 Tax=Psilocybe cubensis TaxID=181762 RepID=A0ACB8HEK8_PSICU|nr:Exocyst complex component SEC3 [Psilocybe cubensis]KAH9486264.1 Exocyst complex component SEC3 [Psilocybe cubensis]
MDGILDRFTIATSFPEKDTGEPNEQTYVSHLKVWQGAGREGDSMQCRYIVLSEHHDGSACLHKSKLNSNGTLSVGKTFRLSGLRKVVVSSPYLFSLIFSKTYRWRSEARADQTEFLETLISTFRKVTKGQIPLQLTGLHDCELYEMKTLFDIDVDTPTDDVPSHSAPDSSQIDGKSPSPSRNCNESSYRQISVSQDNSIASMQTMFAISSAPVNPANSSSLKQDPPIHSALCFFCDSRIVGDRYHPDHAFVRIKASEDHIRARPSVKQMHNTTCKGCSMSIYGCRFKCMHPECPDYNLCETCEALPIPVHSVLHPMLKIKTPGTLIPLVRSSMHGNMACESPSFTSPTDRTTVIPKLELIPKLEFESTVFQLPTDTNPWSNSLTNKNVTSELPKRRSLPVPLTVTNLVDPLQTRVSLTNANTFTDMTIPDNPNSVSTSAYNPKSAIPMEMRPSCASNLTLTKPSKLPEPLQFNTNDSSIAIDHPFITQSSQLGCEELSPSLTNGKDGYSRSTAHSTSLVVSPEEEDDIDLVSVSSSPIDDDDEGLFRECRIHISPEPVLTGRMLRESESAKDYVLVDDFVYKH